MLEMAGKPLIEYSLDNCVRIAPREIVIVVGYLADQIVNHYGDSYRGIPIRYVHQAEQRGLVHALDTAAPSLADGEFMLFLADEVLLDPHHEAMLAEFRRSRVFALCGLTRPRDPEAVRNTYAVLEDQQGRVLRLVEKPRRALNPWQGTGNILFDRRILDYIPLTPINPARGERELPDLIQCAIDDGWLVKSFPVGGLYLNINRPEDLAVAETELPALARAARA